MQIDLFESILFKRLVLLTTILILASYVFFDLYAQNYLLGSVADDAYYFAVADSFSKYGEWKDITVIPNELVITAHWGIVVVYSILLSLGFKFVGISIVSMFLGLLLFLVSLFYLDKIKNRVGAHKVPLSLIALGLAVSELFMVNILSGRTESFFFPLSIIWVSFLFEENNSLKKTVLITILSIVLFSFRMQALILFLSSIITFLLLGKFGKSFKYLIISTISVSCVTLINKVFTGVVSSRGEQAIANQLVSFDVNAIFSNFMLSLSLLSNNKDINALNIILIISAIAGFVYLLLQLIKKSTRFEWLFMNILVFGALASFMFTLGGNVNHSHLRYIAYIIPYLFIFIFLLINRQPNLIIKNSLLLLFFIALAFPTLKRIQSDYRHLDFVKLKNHRTVNRFNYFAHLDLTSNEQIYGYKLVGHETRRLVYASTRQSLIRIDRLNELSLKKGYLLFEKDQLEDVYTFITDTLYNFKINNEYILASIK